MDRAQKIAVVSAASALVLAAASGRVPRSVRVGLVLAAAVLVGGVALFSYRSMTRPTALTVAIGSIEGDAPKVMNALAGKLASSGAPIRLKVVDKQSPQQVAKAFSEGAVDLAVLRADIADLPDARTVLVVTHAVVLFLSLGKTVKEIGDLKGKTVGVVGGGVNRGVVDALRNEYDLDRLKVRFQDVPLAEIGAVLKAKQVAALLVVTPVTRQSLALMRSLFPRAGKSKPALVAIDAAAAIAQVAQFYESYDIPKGTLRGSPPLPEDDLTTLRVPVYLIARKSLPDDVAAAVAKAIMDGRRELVGEYPLLAQIAAPNTDKDTTDKDVSIPIHPGAAAYFDGDQKTFFDEYGDLLSYGSMGVGALTGLLAATWRYLTAKSSGPQHPLVRLDSLGAEVRNAETHADLAQCDDVLDEIIRSEFAKRATGDPAALEPSVLDLSVRRLERLLESRRAALEGATAARRALPGRPGAATGA